MLVLGTFTIVLMLSVTTSPVSPSPRVTAFVNLPFSYVGKIPIPSNFGSTEKVVLSVLSLFRTLSSNL